MEKGNVKTLDISLYIVSDETLAIVMLNKSETLIIEKRQQFIVLENMLRLLEKGYETTGTTLDGAIKASRSILKIKRNPPIIFNNSACREQILMFLGSINNHDLVAVNASQVMGIDKVSKGTMIIFSNTKKIVVKETETIVKNKYFKAMLLDCIYKSSFYYLGVDDFDKDFIWKIWEWQDSRYN